MTNLRFDTNFKDTPLFDYLEEKKSEEIATKEVSSKNSSIRKYYLVNFSLVFGIMLSVYVMMYVQFKFDEMQNRVNLVQEEINEYKDEIKLLNVEWCYLTRPNRLRYLSKKYLNKNRTIVFDQVKSYAQLEKFSLAKIEKNNVALR